MKNVISTLIHNKKSYHIKADALSGVIVYPQKDTAENMMQWTEISSTENL